MMARFKKNDYIEALKETIKYDKTFDDLYQVGNTQVSTTFERTMGTKTRIFYQLGGSVPKFSRKLQRSAYVVFSSYNRDTNDNAKVDKITDDYGNEITHINCSVDEMITIMQLDRNYGCNLPAAMVTKSLSVNNEKNDFIFSPTTVIMDKDKKIQRVTVDSFKKAVELCQEIKQSLNGRNPYKSTTILMSILTFDYINLTSDSKFNELLISPLDTEIRFDVNDFSNKKLFDQFKETLVRQALFNSIFCAVDYPEKYTNNPSNLFGYLALASITDEFMIGKNINVTNENDTNSIILEIDRKQHKDCPGPSIDGAYEVKQLPIIDLVLNKYPSYPNLVDKEFIQHKLSYSMTWPYFTSNELMKTISFTYYHNKVNILYPNTNVSKNQQYKDLILNNPIYYYTPIIFNTKGHFVSTISDAFNKIKRNEQGMFVSLIEMNDDRTKYSITTKFCSDLNNIESSSFYYMILHCITDNKISRQLFPAKPVIDGIKEIETPKVYSNKDDQINIITGIV